MLPTVLAVEYDTHEGGLTRGFLPRPNSAQATDEVRRGRLAVAALVLEADQVAEQVVAEEDVELRAALGDAPRLVELFRRLEVTSGVTVQRAAKRRAEHLLVRRHPAEP